MKPAPTIGVADTADAVMLPGLPEEIALAMSDIAREGLLAMSVAVGTALMTAMVEAEITEVCRPRSNTIQWGTVQSTKFAAKGRNH
jgi:cobalamin synthase